MAFDLALLIWAEDEHTHTHTLTGKKKRLIILLPASPSQQQQMEEERRETIAVEWKAAEGIQDSERRKEPDKYKARLYAALHIA